MFTTSIIMYGLIAAFFLTLLRAAKIGDRTRLAFRNRKWLPTLRGNQPSRPKSFRSSFRSGIRSPYGMAH